MSNTDAGSNSLDSDYNTFIGNASGNGAWTDTKCEFNTSVGGNSMVGALSSAVYNTSLGYRSAEDLTGGRANTIVGSIGGANITTGFGNVVMGYNVAGTLTTGGYNTIIGYQANVSNASVQDEIVLKAGVDALAGAGEETIRIGVDSDYITNDFGENATWTHSSDRRIKKDIENSELGLDFINDLRPVTFKKKAPSEYPQEFDQYNADKTERSNPNKKHYGFIAQEVKEAMDKAGHSDFPVWKENKDGMQELGETELITPLIKAVQELSTEINQLKQQLKDK